MNLYRKVRHSLGSNPLVYRFYRFITGKVGPRWHLVIRFHARKKTWSCKSYIGYQSRNIGSLHLICSAMEAIRPRLTKSFTAHAWLGDMPPPWYFCGRHMAYCRSAEQTKTTMIPDFGFWAWPEASIFDYDETARKMVEASKRPFSTRGLFWAGTIQRHPTREIFLETARKDPRITCHAIGWVGDTPDTFGKPLATQGNNFVSMEDHCNYQYLIDLQGGGYSGRLKLLLFSGRPLFIQHRRWQEFFFDRIEPYQHFIPVREDLSDLSQMIDWADNHPAEVAEIAQTAQKFALANLMRKNAVEEFQRIFMHLGAGT